MEKSFGLLAKVVSSIFLITGVGLGSWYIYDETNPTILKSFARKNYSWSPIDHKNINVKKTYGVTTTKQKAFNLFSSKGCVNNFFPGVDWITKGFDSTIAQDTDKKPLLEKEPVFTNKEKAQACLILEIGNNPDNTVGEGLASWELALKKENHGMVLMGYAAESVFELLPESLQSSTDEFRWIAVHLKKEDGTWKTKGGVMWDDSTVGSNHPGQSLKVNFSDKKKYEWSFPGQKPCKIPGATSKLTRTCLGPEKWTTFGLSGFWEESNEDKGQEVFEIIEQKFAGELGNIWGRKNFDFTPYNSNNIKGWNLAHNVLADVNEGWRNTKSDSLDYSDYLSKVYAPFKNKKGTWIDVEDFCNKYKFSRKQEDNETLEKIKSFCLIKN